MRSRHADIKGDLPECVTRIILHARQILVLAKAVTVVDKDRHGTDCQRHRQQYRNHQFDDGKAHLLVGKIRSHRRIAQVTGSI